MIIEKIISSIDQLKSIEKTDNVYVSHWIEDTIPLNDLPSIQYLRLGAKSRAGLGTLTSLKHLNVMYLSKNEEISQLYQLEELLINQGNIVDLHFLDAMQKLKQLVLSYLYKLKDISSICSVSKTLEVLEINSCGNINWQSELSHLQNLKKLILTGFEFDDIEFLRHLPNLQHFSIVGSNVLNGDIGPAKNINYVGIDNKRHYNYKFEDKTMKIIPRN